MTDFTTITPCGECCVSCAKKLDGRCPGCLETEGRVPEWADSGVCRVFACVRKHDALFCGLCAEFPCAGLHDMIPWNEHIEEHLAALRDEYEKLNDRV